MARNKQVEGEWPLYPADTSKTEGVNTHPDAGIPGRDHSQEATGITAESPRIAPIAGRVRRRGLSSSEPTSPAWKRLAAQREVTPKRREKGWVKRKIERRRLGIVETIEVRPYTITEKHPRVDVYNPLNDPEFRRLDSINDCVFMAIKSGKTAKRPGGWTDAFVMNRVGSEDEVLIPRRFNTSYGTTELVSVQWRQIRETSSRAKPTS